MYFRRKLSSISDLMAFCMNSSIGRICGGLPPVSHAKNSREVLKLKGIRTKTKNGTNTIMALFTVILIDVTLEIRSLRADALGAGFLEGRCPMTSFLVRYTQFEVRTAITPREIRVRTYRSVNPRM